jgi:hypothetical protein
MVRGKPGFPAGDLIPYPAGAVMAKSENESMEDLLDSLLSTMLFVPTRQVRPGWRASLWIVRHAPLRGDQGDKLPAKDELTRVAVEHLLRTYSEGGRPRNAENLPSVRWRRASSTHLTFQVEVWDGDTTTAAVEGPIWFALLSFLHRRLKLREIQGFPFAYWSWFVTGVKRKWPIPRPPTSAHAGAPSPPSHSGVGDGDKTK